MEGNSFSVKCVVFRKEGKPEYPEKNPRSTGEINYEELNTHRQPTRRVHRTLVGFFSGKKNTTRQLLGH